MEQSKPWTTKNNENTKNVKIIWENHLNIRVISDLTNTDTETVWHILHEQSMLEVGAERSYGWSKEAQVSFTWRQSVMTS